MSNESVNSRNSMSFEQVLQENGQLVYTNVGDSMWPALPEKKKLRFIVRPLPEATQGQSS